MIWKNSDRVSSKNYTCGYCSNLIASNSGYILTDDMGRTILRTIHICPHCSSPSFFINRTNEQLPQPMPGNSVLHLPNDIEVLYNEARRAVSISAPTSAVLACRKLLMNIAVSQGAKEGAKFVEYVDHLAAKGFIPPNGKEWVDHIRSKGNEANHEIKLMSTEDASDLISFAEMLLKFIYEYPNKIPKPKGTSQ